MELSASKTENAEAVSVLTIDASLQKLLDHVESNQEVDSTLVVTLLMELSASRTENAEAVSVLTTVASLQKLLDQVERIQVAVETGTANQISSVAETTFAQISAQDLSNQSAWWTMIATSENSALPMNAFQNQ